MLSLLLIITSSSCQTFQGSNRLPNQSAEKVTPAADQTQENSQLENMIEQVLKKQNDARLKLATDIRSTISIASLSQQLSSSFDLYLDFKLAHSAKDANVSTAPSASEINCKLWENSYFYNDAEEKLISMQMIFLNKANEESYHWFLSFFKSTKGDTAAQIMAKAQLVRALYSDYKQRCEGQACVAFLSFPGKPSAAFDPFNDQQMFDFKKKFSKKIANYSPGEIELMPKGACFQDASNREPNTEEVVYDWKTRNKTGRKLANGEFIITYDDGPHPVYTNKIIEAWQQAGLAKPTFFWLAENVKKYAALSREVSKKGLEVAVHSYSHPDIGNLASSKDATQLNKVNRSLFAKDLKNLAAEDYQDWQSKMLDRQIVESFNIVANEIGADKVKKFRLPYGSGVRNALIGNRFTKLGVDHFFWDIDSLDWQDKNPLSIVERIHKQMEITHKGIILFHDIHPQSLEASKILIQEFKENKNGKVVNLDEAHL